MSAQALRRTRPARLQGQRQLKQRGARREDVVAVVRVRKLRRDVVQRQLFQVKERNAHFVFDCSSACCLDGPRAMGGRRGCTPTLRCRSESGGGGGGGGSGRRRRHDCGALLGLHGSFEAAADPLP